MKKTALITGASSGIGWEFAKIFAQHGYNLVLTARREDRLNTLKNILHKAYDVEVTCIVCDLTEKTAAEGIVDRVKRLNLTIDVLVNNAGFGVFGKFVDTDAQRLTDMIQVNVTALVQLTRLLVPGMVERKEGHILNVASMAGFVPGPLMSVYYASKSFVISFSEALCNELKNTSVHVTVLCPGPVKSEFQQVAYEKDTRADSAHIPTAQETAQFGFEAMQNKELFAIPGAFNRLMPFLVRVLPRSVVTHIVRSRQELINN